MAVNAQILRRPSDRSLFLIAAVLFPLLVVVGYARTYYFGSLFGARPLANTLVHAHGLVMSTWVIYFVAQIALVRSKNLKLHMSMGFAGIALAVLVVIVGMATAWDSLMIRRNSPAGIDPHSFFLVPVVDMLLFVVFFAGAIYYRKRPAEHKTLMLMTAVNFAPAAVARIPLGLPESLLILQAFVFPFSLAVAAFVWHSYRHRKINKVFAASIGLFVLSLARFPFSNSEMWLNFANWISIGVR